MAHLRGAFTRLTSLANVAPPVGVTSTNFRFITSIPPARAFAAGSHTSGNDPEVLEKEKKRNLRGEQDSPHVEGWNEDLASESEAAVKADQHVAHEDHDQHIEDLQDLSEKAHAEDHGKSS